MHLVPVYRYQTLPPASEGLPRVSVLSLSIFRDGCWTIQSLVEAQLFMHDHPCDDTDRTRYSGSPFSAHECKLSRNLAAIDVDESCFAGGAPGQGAGMGQGQTADLSALIAGVGGLAMPQSSMAVSAVHGKDCLRIPP